MIRIFVDQLEFGGRGGTQALGKKVTNQVVGVHILVTYMLASFVCLFPHTRKKSCNLLLFFCQSDITENFKFIQTKEFELVFGSQIMC